MANVIDILVSKQAQAELDKVISSLKVTHEEIIKINQQGLKINSGASPKNPVDLNATIKQNEELTKKYKEQEEKLKQLNAQKQKAQLRTSEEIVNQKALAQASDRQARATSALVGAMANLNAKHQQAKKTLQDLIASQTASNSQIRKAQKEYDALDKRVVHANNAVRQFNYNVGNYPKQAISGIRNLVGAFGIVGGVSLFATIAQDIFKTTKELQGLDNALKQVSGTQEAFNVNQQFLRKTSEDFGLEIKGLTQQFTQFYVSAKDKLSQSEIEGIFTSISKSGSVMGLSIDAQNRAFNALNQMMSKGVVSSEELKGQLGEALPGAFGIMAKSLNVNEQQLGKMLQQGKLLASDVLPKFAEQLEKVYGIETIDRVETLSASQNRLSNSWTEMIRSLNESETGGISQFFKTMIDGLNTILNLIIEANKGIEEFKKQTYSESRSNIVAQVQNMASSSASSIIEGQGRRGTKQDDFETLKRTKELEIATNELNRQKAQYIQALKDEATYEELLNVEKKESKSLITGGIFNLNDLNKAQKRYDDALLNSQRIRGNIDGLMSLINKKEEENTKVVTANTGALNKNVKAKEEIGADKFSKTWFEQTISGFKKEADAMSYANPMRKVMIEQIKLLTLSYQALYGEQKKQESVQDPRFGTLEYYEKLKTEIQNQQKTIATTNPEWEHYQRLLEAVQIDIDILTGKQEKLNETFFDSQGYFKGFVDSFANESGFSEIFNVMDLLNQNFETVEEKAKVVGLAISEAFQEAFNTLSTMSDDNYQQMYSNLERQRDVSIMFAGESVTARQEIERQYEERRKKIQRQQAESQKRMAIFNAVINTAQAVVAALPNFVLAAIVGAIGAAQVALIASQPIPQFYKGTQNAPEGLAWTDEKGAELHTDSKGNIKDLGSSKGARLKKLEKGDKIYTATQTKKMMDLYGFNQDFNNIMLTNGISTSNFNNNSVNLEPLNARLDKLTSVVANKSEVTIVNNESGTRYYERVNGQRRELVNSVLTMKSRTIR